MDLIKDFDLNYSDIVELSIQNFNEYIQENNIKNIILNDINNFVISMHYDILNNCESIEDIQYIENIIANILKKEYKIKGE